MPRQRINYSRSTYGFPEDFPERLVRFQEASGLSWSEIARRIGTYRATVWRWTEGVVRPNGGHMLALLALADDLGIRHLFTEEARARGWGQRPHAPRGARGRTQGRGGSGRRWGSAASRTRRPLLAQPPVPGNCHRTATEKGPNIH